MRREKRKRRSLKRESIDAGHRGGPVRSSDETAVMAVERRGRVTRHYHSVNQKWEELVDKAKPFQISKRIVYDAYL